MTIEPVRLEFPNVTFSVPLQASELVRKVVQKVKSGSGGTSLALKWIQELAATDGGMKLVAAAYKKSLRAARATGNRNVSAVSFGDGIHGRRLPVTTARKIVETIVLGAGVR